MVISRQHGYRLDMVLQDVCAEWSKGFAGLDSCKAEDE